MTCALAPSNPSSRFLTTSPVTRGASPLLWVTLGPCALPSPPLRPPPLPLPLLKVTAPMRTTQTGLVLEPLPPHRPPGEMRSLMWRDTTQMTPVSDAFSSCRPHPTVYHYVFMSVYIPFSSSSPFPFLLLLHLHFCHRLPGIPPAVWLCGFICHLFFPRLPCPSLCISDCLAFVTVCICVRACACAHAVCLHVCAYVLQLTLSLSVDRQPTVAAAKITARPSSSSSSTLLQLKE